MLEKTIKSVFTRDLGTPGRDELGTRKIIFGKNSVMLREPLAAGRGIRLYVGPSVPRDAPMPPF